LRDRLQIVRKHLEGRLLSRVLGLAKPRPQKSTESKVREAQKINREQDKLIAVEGNITVQPSFGCPTKFDKHKIASLYVLDEQIRLDLPISIKPRDKIH
jgi:hypothetical protein